jgi:hypothetical protein
METSLRAFSHGFTRHAAALFLGAALLATATAQAGNHGSHAKPAADIVDTAVAAGSFTTLAAALDAAGLIETLKGDGPFTVFAPTDAAFAKLPAGTVESLLKPENKDQLVAVLTYHVVPGKVKAADVVKLSSAKTVNGQSRHDQGRRRHGQRRRRHRHRHRHRRVEWRHSRHRHGDPAQVTLRAGAAASSPPRLPGTGVTSARWKIPGLPQARPSRCARDGRRHARARGGGTRSADRAAGSSRGRLQPAAAARDRLRRWRD